MTQASAETIDGSKPQYKELRVLLVACQALSVVVTWPLWIARTGEMPNLPAIESPAFAWLNVDFPWLLLGSLAIVLVRPLPGLVVHMVLLVWAMLADQMRIQPEFVSLAILLWGATGRSFGLFIARAHLIALWFYAGLHKVLSHAYWYESGPQNFQETLPGIPYHVAIGLAVALALAESLVGVLAVFPRTRRAAAIGACLLHVGILLSLMLRSWNLAVWPWNLALAVSGFAFFWSWQPTPIAAVRVQPWLARLVAAAVLLSPVLYYCDRLDAYLCHCVYSDNTPSAAFYQGSEAGEYLGTRSYRVLNVPFPPAHRLYDQFFRIVAEPGDYLEIEDPRWWARRSGRSTRSLEYPALESGRP